MSNLKPRGPRILGALLFVATVLGCMYGVYDHFFTVDRFIIAASPIDKERALVLYRMDYDRAEPYFRVGVLQDAAMRWEKAMPEGENQLGHGADHGSMVADAASDHAFFIASNDPKVLAHITALELSDGSVAWTRDLPISKRRLSVQQGPTVLEDVLLIPGPGASLWALDTKTGEVRWKSAPLLYVNSIEPLVVTLESGDVKVLDPKTGASRAEIADPHGSVCLGLGRAIWLEGKTAPDGAWSLRSIELATGKALGVVPLPKRFMESNNHLDDCAVHDGALILVRTLRRRKGAPKGTPEREISIDAIDLASGEVRWTKVLEDVYRGTNITAPVLYGDVPRFTPMVLSRKAGENLSEHQWLVLDLATGRVHSKGSFDQEKGYETIRRRGQDWVMHVNLPGPNERLVLLDGDTGKVTRAWDSKSLVHLHNHWVGEELWAHARWTWTREGDMAWFRFAPPAYEVSARGNTELPLVDATPMARAAFGQ